MESKSCSSESYLAVGRNCKKPVRAYGQVVSSRGIMIAIKAANESESIDSYIVFRCDGRHYITRHPVFKKRERLIGGNYRMSCIYYSTSFVRPGDGDVDRFVVGAVYGADGQGVMNGLTACQRIGHSTGIVQGVGPDTACFVEGEVAVDASQSGRSREDRFSAVFVRHGKGAGSQGRGSVLCQRTGRSSADRCDILAPGDRDGDRSNAAVAGGDVEDFGDDLTAV